MRHVFQYAMVVGSAILLLAACGGGAAHTGREAASPTPTRLMSDFIVFDDSGLRSRIDVSCSADTCETTHLGTTETLGDDRSSDSWTVETQPVRPRNGISLAYRSAWSATAGGAPQYTGYGGWLTYNAFGYWDGARQEFGREVQRVYSYSHGLAANTNPPRGGDVKGRHGWCGCRVDIPRPYDRGGRRSHHGRFQEPAGRRVVHQDL